MNKVRIKSKTGKRMEKKAYRINETKFESI